MILEILLILCVASAMGCLGYFFAHLLVAHLVDDQKLRGRLGVAISSGRVKRPKSGPWWKRSGLSAAELFMPRSREEQSRLRKSLGRAGIYSPAALRVLVGSKAIGMGAGLIGGYLVGLIINQVFFAMSVGGLIGYLMPMMWLKSRMRTNRREIEYGMADALDLMVVCMEAGLTIDAAMQRVGQEMSLAHPALSRELGITHIESRVGIARTEAMKNLGERTSVQSLQSLAGMLGQAERFGTSVAAALRVHADSLRSTRQHAAEELAAKASVKMSFPLVVCIFPATFIVLAGPTVLELLHSALFQ